MAAVDVGRLRCHRRVEVERQLWDLARPREVDRGHIRSPGSARSRTTGRAARRRRRRPSERSRPGSGSPRPGARARVRRRSTPPARSRRRARTVGSRMIGVSGRPRSPENTIIVSRSGPPCPTSPASIRSADDRGPEDVPGVEVGRVDARRDLALLVVADCLELPDRRLGVVGGV